MTALLEVAAPGLAAAAPLVAVHVIRFRTVYASDRRLYQGARRRTRFAHSPRRPERGAS